MQDETYAQLKQQIARFLDLDIDAYKQRQMRRRLDTWVEQHAAGDEPRFVRSLGVHSELLKDLRDTLTINVTEFFRDQAQWTDLEKKVLPELMAASPRLKIWSAGCSSGDEPYSVAMLLDEAGRGANSSLLATDLDPGSLTRAKAGGPYVADAVKNMTPERLAKYFTVEGNRYQVNEALRRRVEFKPLNLLKDRFGSGYDLILCRNVTIYFDGPVKAALTRRFYEALRPGGVLFIGATEALLGAESDGFTRTTGNFYQKGSLAPARVARAA
ncbi:MAG: protein-glutamate O-methyltransferase CheR [Dehalococcoidia bacterium]